MKNNKLSIIVPAYRQGDTLVKNIRKITSVLEEVAPNAYEVIVVEDGKLDNSFELLEKANIPHVKLVGYGSNHGKGYAVRYGMARSTGDIIGFIDAGADLDPKGLKILLVHMEWYGADIIVGSKWHPVSRVKYPWWRKIISKGYGLYVKLLFGLDISDTQLGMKFFRREVLKKVLPRLLVKKYAMDIELLAVANRIGFTRIYEAPIELDWSQIDSQISKNMYRSIWDMALDTLAVFYRLRILHYYDDSSKRNWRFDKDLQMKVNIG